MSFYSFSEDSSIVALDAETGDITLTSDLSEVTEDTLLTLTAIATDQGTPAQSDEGLGLVYITPMKYSCEPGAKTMQIMFSH